METLKLIAKGAEADLWLDMDWNGKRVILKKRVCKKYRHPELDWKIRSYRTIHEADIIHRAKEAGVPTPLVFQVSHEKCTFVMEYVDGERLREILNEIGVDEARRIFRLIGKCAGRLHIAGIIHGDLTTSNIIKSGDSIVFIDFGLGEVSLEAEKRGVDLHLMKRMLTSTHFNRSDEFFTSFKEGYKESMGLEADEALIRMMEIDRRGRYAER